MGLLPPQQHNNSLRLHPSRRCRRTPCAKDQDDNDDNDADQKDCCCWAGRPLKSDRLMNEAGPRRTRLVSFSLRSFFLSFSPDARALSRLSSCPAVDRSISNSLFLYRFHFSLFSFSFSLFVFFYVAPLFWFFYLSLGCLFLAAQQAVLSYFLSFSPALIVGTMSTRLGGESAHSFSPARAVRCQC